MNFASQHQPKQKMKTQYRNGREAKNGDQVVSLDGGRFEAFGVVRNVTPSGDGCIDFVQSSQASARLCDCLHIDDCTALLAAKGLDKRPEEK